MTASFPPRPTRVAEIELAVNAIASTVDGRVALYVSTPITTGPRFVAWLRDKGSSFARSSAAYRDGHTTAVVRPNVAAAAPIVRDLRARMRQPVIDPTAFPDAPGWTQDDYRELWTRVIQRFATRVVFIDGWEYSEGCCLEYLVAFRSGATCVDSRERPLPRDQALERMSRAYTELASLDVDTGFIRQVRDTLATL
jgi:hypothetical protein